MKPRTRQTIGNVCLCLRRDRDLSAVRCRRFFRLMSRAYHRDHNLTGPQAIRLLTALERLAEASGTHNRPRRLRKVYLARHYLIAATLCPDD